MARHGIGFVSESNARADGKDLLLGVLICSMTCRAWDALIATQNLRQIISDWMRQIKAAPPWYLTGRYGRILAATRIGRWWRSCHSFDLLAKSKLFQMYVEDAQRVPKFLRKGNEGGMSVSHWSHNIEVVLRGELGWTREEIEERPLSNAIADYFKFMENQGLITILTDADFEEIRHNDEVMKKAMQEYNSRLSHGMSNPLDTQCPTGKSCNDLAIRHSMTNPNIGGSNGL